MTVGVVADGEDAEETAAAVRAAGLTAARGDARTVADGPHEFVVARGEAALLALARERVTAPVLPVAAGSGVESVPSADVTDAAAAVAADDWTARDHPVLSVSVNGDRVGRAFADVMLTTEEPARISEYGVATEATRVATFRADGVVVATPAGTHGYASDAGSPVVAPESGVVAVVPVAPFAIDMDHWVLASDRPTVLTVERDEGAVDLYVDDREVRSVTPDDAVTVVADETLTIATVAASGPPFDRFA